MSPSAQQQQQQQMAHMAASMQPQFSQVYYMPQQPPPMYYPPSAYAYPGGVAPNIPSKDQVEEAVRKQVRAPRSQRSMLPCCIPVLTATCLSVPGVWWLLTPSHCTGGILLQRAEPVSRHLPTLQDG